MNPFIRVALVGAPGSGKTTGLVVLKGHLKALGFEVRLVPEGATLALRLMKPADPRTHGGPQVVELQRAVYRFQVTMEDVVMVAPAKSEKGCVVICDRGVLDGEVYLDKKVWKKLVEEEKGEYGALAKRYDVVIHLGTTAGLGDESVYKAEGVRLESRKLAMELEKRVWAVWGRHPGYVFVQATEVLEEKWEAMKRAVESLIP